MNSVIQMMAHIPAIYDRVSQQAKAGVVEILKTLMAEIFNKQVSIASPSDLKQALGKINSDFQGVDQFDANEFFMMFTDILDREMPENPISQLFAGELQQ